MSIPSRRDSSQKVSMSKQHIYVLGVNICDHDVNACLLRDIAFAIAKERITRRRSRADQHVIQRKGRAGRRNTARCRRLLPDHRDRQFGPA
jgi:hypothetical protein